MPVQFVSAGLLEGTIKEREQVNAESGSESDDESIAPSTSSSLSPPDNTTAMARMAIRSPSPAPSEASSSSGDEVVFQGRGNTSAPLSTTQSRVESPLPQKQAAAVAEAVTHAVEETKEKAEAVASQVAGSTSLPVEVRPKVNISIRVKGTVVTEQPHVDLLLMTYRIAAYRFNRTCCSPRARSRRRVRYRHCHRRHVREATRGQASVGRRHNTMGAQVETWRWMAACRRSSRHECSPGR